MSYATVDDLKDRIGGMFAEIYSSDDLAAEDLADASAEIDGCIGKRYAVPVSSESALPLLRGWALTLAEERTYSRAAGSDFSEKIKARVAQVRKYLEDIRAGTFLLSGAAETDKSVFTLFKAESPVFSRDSMEGF